ncbi:hypothetical protein HPB51_004230 [Rhipicephalus microplus]|uniref:Uncharacterized protein n=1 Tax=Rhipicephalus microplus TaxID=6941 RepID=A0A9J6ERB8_RHIMP|nr:hypothetical protein HPB51_004230 [Rhipicephalus microplus]
MGSSAPVLMLEREKGVAGGKALRSERESPEKGEAELPKVEGVKRERGVFYLRGESSGDAPQRGEEQHLFRERPTGRRRSRALPSLWRRTPLPPLPDLRSSGGIPGKGPRQSQWLFTRVCWESRLSYLPACSDLKATSVPTKGTDSPQQVLEFYYYSRGSEIGRTLYLFVCFGYFLDMTSVLEAKQGSVRAPPAVLALEFAGLHCPRGSVVKVAPSAASRVPLGWPARLLCRGVKLKQRLVSGLLLAASAILFLTLVRITGVRQLPPFASPAQGWVPSHSKGAAGQSPLQPPSGPDPSGVLGKRLLTKASVEGGSKRTASEAAGGAAGGQADVAQPGSQVSSRGPPPVLSRNKPSPAARGSKRSDPSAGSNAPTAKKGPGNAASTGSAENEVVADAESRQRAHDPFEDLVHIAWPPADPVRGIVRPRRYNPTLGHILQIETSNNMTSWEQFQTGIAREWLYPENSELIERILREMATLPIVHVGLKDGGTQLKLIIDYENGGQALFKPMREVSPKLTFMVIEKHRRNGDTIARLIDKTANVMRLFTRVASRRAGMREESLIRLIQFFIISHVAYVASYHRWLQHERNKINAIIRRAYKAALGLFESMSASHFLQLGIHNTLEEIAEAIQTAQLERLSKTKTDTGASGNRMPDRSTD